MHPLALKRSVGCETQGMCRSIITLRRPEPEVSWEECEAAARQYVRKISGYRTPSKANEEVFERAVHDIAHMTQDLLGGLVVGGVKR
jgi:hypothetical protein